MKTTYILAVVTLLAFGLPLPWCLKAVETNAPPRQEWTDLHREALKFRRSRLVDEKGEIPPDAWMKATAQRKQMPTAQKVLPKGPTPKIAGISSSSWIWLGPGNVGGRVLAILIHPTNPSIMWVGSASGGVWKTVNSGASWFPLDDFMANLVIGCMAMDRTDPNVIYVGTGEARGDSNINGGNGGGGRIQGSGIFKTTDGGTSWTRLPSTAGTDFFYVNRMAISPDNHVLLAGTLTGIFRSADGGGSWTKPLAAEFIDVVFHPTDNLKCIGSGPGSLRYSTDGGLNWVNATGIPADGGRIELAYAASNPDIVYATYDRNNGELYRSADGGHTYTLKNTGTSFFNSGNGSQGGYDNALWVDPTNPNKLVVGGIWPWLSTDGGSTFNLIVRPNSEYHDDQHVIVAHPSFNGTSVKTVYFGNDGGVVRADDIYSGTASGWANLNNNLGITQFYGGAGNVNDKIIAGAQDNGTQLYTPAGGPNGWTRVGGADGGFCAADPTDSKYFYDEIQFLRIARSTDGANSFANIFNGLTDAGSAATAPFIAPFILDPNNSSSMLAGGVRLWRSANVKATTPTWAQIKASVGSLISAIAVAPGNSDIIWVGHNDGRVYKTSNGTAVNPSWTQMDRNTPGLPARYCTRIAVDPNNSSIAYATFAGFSSANVWRTPDGGNTWIDVSSNLPQAPVYSIVINPHISSYLYVGTEVGIFASSDSGATWSPNNDGPANVIVDELFWVGEQLVAATHGRGCYAIQPITWVGYNPVVIQFGTYDVPYSSFFGTLLNSGAVDIVPREGTIAVKGPYASHENFLPQTINKPMTIISVGGPATIGN